MSLNDFAAKAYQVHNAARLGHLASLGLPLDGKRVLEVGAGPGDHTGFYLERGCTVTSTDARQECVDELQARHPGVEAHVVDMNRMPMKPSERRAFDVVHCYGLLYHLEDPGTALRALAFACKGILLLETCVSVGDGLHINLVDEAAYDATQSATGHGCRPTREWVFHELQQHFEHVYQTITQPNHPEFPLDWTARSKTALSRAVFVGSREPLDESVFSASLLMHQGH
jgi:SAM-dependent methyltransferase